MTTAAPAFHPTLLAIESMDVATVQPYLLPRSAPRKAQAAALRSLLKGLGLKDVSVTVPTYSMAMGVQVRLPRVEQTEAQLAEYQAAHGHEEVEATELMQIRARRGAIARKFNALLDVVFPHHRDKSDTQTDSYNFCWMVD